MDEQMNEWTDGWTNNFYRLRRPPLMFTFFPLLFFSHYSSPIIHHPSSISDNGTEFSQIASPDFERKWQLEIYKTHLDNVKKNSITEIANKLLENRIYKLMHAKKDYAWSYYLGNIVSGINSMKRQILFGYSSAQIKRDIDVQSIVKKHFMLKLDAYQRPFKDKKPKFELNQSVKVVRKSHIFQRGYTKKTEEKPDKIKKVITSSAPYTYMLEHKRRPYYASELIPYVSKDESSEGEDNFKFYISETKPVERRHLRSGKTHTVLDEKLYHLRKYESDSFGEWIDSFERQRLIDDGKLQHQSSPSS